MTSSINPSRFRQSVTLTAAVTADGMPVTSGTIAFTRGNTLIGDAALGPDGTATLTTSSLPRKNVRIQAAFTGNADDYGSGQRGLHPGSQQGRHRHDARGHPAQIRGIGREELVAAVDAIGLVGVLCNA